MGASPEFPSGEIGRCRWVAPDRSGEGSDQESQENCHDRLDKPNQKPSMALVLSSPPDP